MRVHAATVWRFARPKSELNFLDVLSRQEAEWLSPKVRVATVAEERQHRRAVRPLVVCEADELAMANLREDHPE